MSGVASPSSSRLEGKAVAAEGLPSLAVRGAVGEVGDESNVRNGGAGAGQRDETLPSLAPVGLSVPGTKTAFNLVRCHEPQLLLALCTQWVVAAAA
jgi:hypothetical protein